MRKEVSAALPTLLLVGVWASPAVGQEAPGGARLDASSPETRTPEAEAPPPPSDDADASPREAEPEDAPSERAPRPLHDPEGSFNLGFTGGLSASSRATYGFAGASLGYAIWTGVVPGLRGTVFFGDFSGGEAAATLTLTPPLSWSVVPFAFGEIGWAAQSELGFGDQGVLAGVGGGLHLGHPADRFTVRGGVVYRYYGLFGGRAYFTPLLGLGLRF